MASRRRSRRARRVSPALAARSADGGKTWNKVLYKSPRTGAWDLVMDPANPDVLINEMRMEDPEALAEPFEVTTRYRRDRHGTLLEFQCSENDRNPVNAAGETEFD